MDAALTSAIVIGCCVLLYTILFASFRVVRELSLCFVIGLLFGYAAKACTPVELHWYLAGGIGVFLTLGGITISNGMKL